MPAGGGGTGSARPGGGSRWRTGGVKSSSVIEALLPLASAGAGSGRVGADVRLGERVPHDGTRAELVGAGVRLGARLAVQVVHDEGVAANRAVDRRAALDQAEDRAHLHQLRIRDLAVRP